MSTIEPYGIALPLAAGLFAFTTASCVRQYVPRSPRSAHADGASAAVTALYTAPPQSVYPPVGAVALQGSYRKEQGVTLAVPRLAPDGAAPCSAGVPASTTLWADDSASGSSSDPTSNATQAGSMMAIFRRDGVDRLGLLRAPTALDVAVFRQDGSHDCLRLPVVVRATEPEWSEHPVFSWGVGVDLFVPFRPIYAADAASMFVFRMGPWVGPVRLRSELGLGGAFEKNTNANLVSYVLRAGIVLDALVVHTGRFGLGVSAGYDTMAFSLRPNVEDLSHQGEGYQGLIHGPRAGLSFALLPQVPPGPAFDARPDTTSATFELFGAAVSSHDYASATPAIWMTLAIDGGL